jgi:hypothetical protein
MRRIPRPAATARAIFAVLVLISTGCERGDVILFPAEQSGTGGSSLTLHVTVDPQEADSTLGWADGVPDASVTITRVLDYLRIDGCTGRTDGEGMIRFTDVPTGRYWVSASVDGGAAAGSVYAGGMKVEVTGEVEAHVLLRADRPGTLVFSELALEEPPGWETNGLWYHYHKFIELYNNSDGTVYLDGMLLGRIYNWPWDFSDNGHHACTQTEPLRNDPDGIWTNQFLQFPGSGSDHPVPPGQTVVIAVSAADHRAIHPSMTDLSDADFETLTPKFGGEFALGDNPFAPNLLDVGPYQFVSNSWLIGGIGWFLAEPTDPGTLPRRTDPGGGLAPRDYIRMPASAVIDAVVIWTDWTDSYMPTPVPWRQCRDPVHESFYTIPGGFFTNKDRHISAQRRVTRTADGRRILLRTGVGPVDFVMQPATPGRLP